MSGNLIEKKQLSEAELLDIEFKKNPLFWGMNFLKHHFRKNSPDFHLEILLDALKHRFFAIASPRESAKSTILTFLLTVHGVVFKKFRFIVIVQNTEQKACESLNAVKMEVKENPMLLPYRINIIRDTKDDTVFQHADGFKTRVLCKGMEQIGSIRGEKYGAYRPDLIIGDDIEDDKMVQNPELRQQLQDHFDQALVPAGQQDVCQYIVVGTILHDDSLMARLVSLNHYKEWHKLLYRALNRDKEGNLYSLWKEVWTVEQLLEMRRTKPDVFAKEYQNDPVSGSLKKFDKEDFRYWHIEEGQAILLDRDQRIISKYKLSDCRAAIAVDLAWEEKRTSDDTVIMPGLLTPGSDLLIDEYICEKGMRPKRLEDYLYGMRDKYHKMTNKTVYIGFEKGKLDKFMKFTLKQAMRLRNDFLNLKDVPWVLDKAERIVSRLQARYKQHMIYHRSGMGELEHQLQRVPSGTHDDLADGAQMLAWLLQWVPTKSKGEVVSQKDEGFEWLMKNAVKKNFIKKEQFVFGRKAHPYLRIPAKVSWR